SAKKITNVKKPINKLRTAFRSSMIIKTQTNMITKNRVIIEEARYFIKLIMSHVLDKTMR
ncbi:hypothetical protein IKE96_03180, partial [bacterium]|nr:hypothetical protein [bacterium]